MCPRSQVRLCPLGLLQRFTEHSGYLLLNKPPQLGDRATTIHQPLRVRSQTARRVAAPAPHLGCLESSDRLSGLVASHVAGLPQRGGRGTDEGPRRQASLTTWRSQGTLSAAEN